MCRSINKLILALCLFCFLALPQHSAEAEGSYHKQVKILNEQYLNAEISVDVYSDALINFVLDKGYQKNRIFNKLQNDSKLKEALSPKIKSGMLTLLKDGELKKARSLERLTERVFGFASKTYQPIRRLKKLASEIELIVDRKAYSELSDLRLDVKSDLDRELLEYRLARAFEEACRDYLGQHKPSLALEQLKLINPQWWSEDSIKLFVRCIGSVHYFVQKPEARPLSWAFDSDNIRQLVSEYAEESTRIKQWQTAAERKKLLNSLIDIYAWRVMFLLKSNNLKSMPYYFDTLVKLRPDPSEENTQLRLKIVKVKATASNQKFLKERMEELEAEGAAPFESKMEKLFGGQIGTVFSILFIGVVFCALAFILLFGIRSKLGSNSIKEMFNKEAMYMRPTTKLDEYSELLALFGLDDSASASEIKEAYRQLMKEYHPDSGSSENELSQADRVKIFRELKSAYERILEIQEARFG